MLTKKDLVKVAVVVFVTEFILQQPVTRKTQRRITRWIENMDNGKLKHYAEAINNGEGA